MHARDANAFQCGPEKTLGAALEESGWFSLGDLVRTGDWPDPAPVNSPLCGCSDTHSDTQKPNTPLCAGVHSSAAYWPPSLQLVLQRKFEFDPKNARWDATGRKTGALKKSIRLCAELFTEKNAKYKMPTHCDNNAIGLVRLGPNSAERGRLYVASQPKDSSVVRWTVHEGNVRRLPMYHQPGKGNDIKGGIWNSDNLAVGSINADVPTGQAATALQWATDLMFHNKFDQVTRAFKYGHMYLGHCTKTETKVGCVAKGHMTIDRDLGQLKGGHYMCVKYHVTWVITNQKTFEAKPIFDKVENAANDVRTGPAPMDSDREGICNYDDDAPEKVLTRSG